MKAGELLAGVNGLGRAVSTIFDAETAIKHLLERKAHSEKQN